MTQELLKEQLAVHHFSLLASSQGCKILRYNLDDGVDLGIDQTATFFENGKVRHHSLGRIIELQFKTTTWQSVARSESFIKFDLEALALSKLIRRRALLDIKSHTAPLLLILLVLPKDPTEWLIVNEQAGETLTKGHFYWYLPDSAMSLPTQKNTRRIEIPLTNRVTLPFFQNIFNLLR